MKRCSSLFLTLVLLSASVAVGQVHDFDFETLTHRGGNPEVNISDDHGAATLFSIEPLFGSDTYTDNLVLIDPATALFEVVGYLNTPIPAGFAYDADTNLLYLTDSVTNDLLMVIPSTGETEVVGNTGLSLMHGAAIDPATGTLFVCRQIPYVTTELYFLDKATAAATYVGDMGVQWVSGLDFDPVTGILYGAVGGPEDMGSIVTIDTATGQATISAPSMRFAAITFTEDGQLIGIDNWSGGLYDVDPSDGSFSLISYVSLDNVLALVFGGDGPVVVERTRWGDLKANFR